MVKASKNLVDYMKRPLLGYRPTKKPIIKLYEGSVKPAVTSTVPTPTTTAQAFRTKVNKANTVEPFKSAIKPFIHFINFNVSAEKKPEFKKCAENIEVLTPALKSYPNQHEDKSNTNNDHKIAESKLKLLEEDLLNNVNIDDDVSTDEVNATTDFDLQTSHMFGFDATEGNIETESVNDAESTTTIDINGLEDYNQ